MQGLDTHEAYDKLKESNFNDRQARGIINIVKQAITGEVATKADLAEVKAELAEVKAELKTDIADLRTELKTDIAQLDARIETVRTELAKQNTRLIVWVVSLFAIIAGAIKSLDFLL